MLHCHVASVPAYTHFIYCFQDILPTKSFLSCIWRLSAGWLYLCHTFHLCITGLIVQHPTWFLFKLFFPGYRTFSSSVVARCSHF